MKARKYSTRIPRRSKYRAKPTKVDGIRFASKKESERYAELKLLERAGAIRDLELQPKFPLIVEGVKVGTYIADFAYRDAESGTKHVEDVKGYRTPEYKFKKKVTEAVYKHVRIEEI